jgi:LacI family transcriptional regulator
MIGHMIGNVIGHMNVIHSAALLCEEPPMSRPASAKKRPQTVTMQDVADLVSVSKQTVSAVINNKPGITEATRERVLAAIEQLGYRLDHTAQSLRTGRTRTIALFITDVSSPVASKMASVAEDCAYAAQYTLVLYNTRDDVKREASYIDSAIQRSVDGALFVATRDDTTALDSLQAAGLPVVVLDRVPDSYTGPAVHLDNKRAGAVAAEHLVSLGHTRIAHVAGPESIHISAERRDGFCEGLRAQGFDASTPCIEQAEGWSIECGYEAARRLLACGADFTAVLCAGDMLAIGAARALREAGRHIPEDVSLMGIDDIDLASYTHPPLTTVSQSIGEMARQAVHMLLELLEGREPEQTRVVIEPILVVRESTAAPPPGRAPRSNSQSG